MNVWVPGAISDHMYWLTSSYCLFIKARSVFYSKNTENRAVYDKIHKINFDYINRLLVGSEDPTRLPSSSLLLVFRQVVKVVNYAKNRLRLFNRLEIDCFFD